MPIAWAITYYRTVLVYTCALLPFKTATLTENWFSWRRGRRTVFTIIRGRAEYADLLPTGCDRHDEDHLRHDFGLEQGLEQARGCGRFLWPYSGLRRGSFQICFR